MHLDAGPTRRPSVANRDGDRDMTLESRDAEARSRWVVQAGLKSAKRTGPGVRPKRGDHRAGEGARLAPYRPGPPSGI